MADLLAIFVVSLGGETGVGIRFGFIPAHTVPELVACREIMLGLRESLVGGQSILMHRQTAVRGHPASREVTRSEIVLGRGLALFRQDGQCL